MANCDTIPLRGGSDIVKVINSVMATAEVIWLGVESPFIRLPSDWKAEGRSKIL